MKSIRLEDSSNNTSNSSQQATSVHKNLTGSVTGRGARRGRGSVARRRRGVGGIIVGVLVVATGLGGLGGDDGVRSAGGGGGGGDDLGGRGRVLLVKGAPGVAVTDGDGCLINSCQKDGL